MLKFIFPEPTLGNNYGVLTTYFQVLMDCLDKRGIESVLVRSGDSDFTRKLMGHLGDPDAVFYAGVFFFDLRITASNHYSNSSIFEACGARVLARIGDHAFATYMVERLENTPPSALLWSDGESLADETRYFFRGPFDVQRARQYATIPPHLQGDMIGHDARPIDVLVPLTVAHDTYDGFIKKIKAIANDDNILKFCARLHEAVLSSYSVAPPLAAFQEVLRLYGIVDWWSVDPALRSVLRHILYEVDELTRKERRAELLRGLADIPPHMKVVVTTDRSSIPWSLPDHIEFIGRQTYETVQSLYTKSRIIVNSAPNFYDSVHERVHNAGYFGCAIISDPSTKTMADFPDGVAMRFVREGLTIGRICAELDVSASQKLGEASRQVVERDYNADLHLDQVLERLGTVSGTAL